MKYPVRARVIEVIDGDTFKARIRRATKTIRIACIDAPEIGQAPYGTISRDFLTRVLTRASVVRLNTIDTDRYQRTVAQVAIGRKDIGSLMVKKGLAFVYEDYSWQCQDEDKLLKLERTAKNRSRGAWGSGKVIMPWDYRSGSSNEGTSEIVDTGFTGYIPAYAGQRLITCAEITSKSAAAAWLKAGHTYLDGDGDGCACETQFPC